VAAVAGTSFSTMDQRRADALMEAPLRTERDIPATDLACAASHADTGRTAH
jgi:hypothetical protein